MTALKEDFWWFVVVAGIVVGLAVGALVPVASAQPVAQKSAPEASALQEQMHREYVLEIIGLGVTLDRHRQGGLWDALKKEAPFASIREQDPKKYPWSAQEKKELEGLRTGHSLENGAYDTMEYWGVPTFAAESPADDPKRPASPTEPVLGIVSGADSSGMCCHLFIAAGWEQSERPDRLLERVFNFFGEHPEVPYVVLSSSDGSYLRNLFRPKGTPTMIKDGHYVPSRPDSSMLFVLARRERADALRPFAFVDIDHFKASVDEMNKYGYARRLGLAYFDLKESLPRAPEAHQRTPTVPEWLEATQAFVRRGDLYPKQRFSLKRSVARMGQEQPSPDYKPTPWFPLPWNQRQLAEFDQLPTLGFLHCPVFVPTVDENGQPLQRREARAAALAAGWQQALQTLPEAVRPAAPARVLAATGGQVEQTIALTTVLDGWAAQGGPELDRGQPTQWIDTDARLGDTGAATWFMQMAVGTIASYREGGASAAINLRDPREASIVFVTPPSAEKIASQKRLKGGDVFRHRGSPAIDPANYAR